MNPNNQDEVGQWVQRLIDDNNIHEFYASAYWQRLRSEVLGEYKYECQHCKAKGFYTKANHVHHQQFVRKHPRLALSKTYMWQGEEYVNLIPVCKRCHETVCHPERLARSKKPLTKEMW